MISGRLSPSTVPLPVQEKALLFVDDDSGFLEVMDRMFRLWSKNQIRIHLAHSVGQAILLLQESKIDAVISDIRMPVVDGLQFIRLIHRKHPLVRKIVLTGISDETYRTACLESGTSLFLEKPRTPEELEIVYTSILELLETSPAKGFSGLVQQANLGEMVQMLCLGGSSVILEIETHQGKGNIYLSKGRILHAQVKDLKGYDAFYFLMSLSGGEFRMRAFEAPVEESITQSWERLLLESARQTDESTAGVKIHLGDTVSLKASSPKKPEAGPKSRMPTKPITKETLLDEILVMSHQGKVLKSHGITDSASRADMVDFLVLKSRQMADWFNAGEFSQLEITGSNERLRLELNAGDLLLGISKQLDFSKIQHALQVWKKGDAQLQSIP
jgi:CheY-like chemotaxis protein